LRGIRPIAAASFELIINLGDDMKTDFRRGGGSMRNVILLSVLLLSACASVPKVGGATGAVTGHRQSNTAQQPAERLRPVPVEVQQPAPGVQGDPPLKKREHNVEPD